MGNYLPCNRRGCRHDAHEHTQTAVGQARIRTLANGAKVIDDQRLLIGACHHQGCLCAQYVDEGLNTTNNLLGIYGDHGMAAPARYAPRMPAFFGPDGRPLG